MTHINALYDQALAKTAKGTWDGPGEFIVREKKTGKDYVIRYVSHYETNIGHVYYGNKGLAYVINPEHRGIASYGIDNINSLRYPDERWKKEHRRNMPNLHTQFVTENGGVFIRFEKETNEYPLREVWEHFNKAMDPKHVAWIMSRLYNINCFLDTIGMVHCDISIDSCLVSPSDHGIRLVGGWWFSYKDRMTVKQLPARTLNNGPFDLRFKKKAVREIDLRLIRVTGKELLGDPTGRSLPRSVPRQMAAWLDGDVSEGSSAIEEYSKWSKEILIESFGARRFVKLDYP